MKTYPKMKETCIPWLGKIPEHWDSKRLRFLFSLYTGISITKDELKEEGIPCIGYGAIHSKYTFDLDLRRDALSCADVAFEKAKPAALLNENDFVFCDTSEDVEGSGNCVHVLHLAGSKLLAGSHTVRLSPIQKMYARYIAYLFKVTGWKAQVHCQVTGTKVYSISQSILKDTVAILPPLDEQRAIAAYLDKTTSKIDALIAAQKHLVELLAEKRKALITHVVTKGLKPKAKLKDTSVSWIGKIPEHWELTCVKHVVKKVGSGKTPKGGSEIYSDEGVMFIRSQNVYNDGLYLDDAVFISEEIDKDMEYTRVYEDDVLLNITGGSIGRSCIYPALGRHANVNQHVCIIRVDQGLCMPQFMHAFWLSYCGQTSIDIFQSGANREGMNFNQINNTLIAIPPLDEQCAISAYLDKATAKLDELAAKAEEAIALMKERRSSLISAVVTGKVKVS